MDHTFNIYIGISYLQLNQFDTALKYMNQSIDWRMSQWNFAHHLEYFYQGVINMELGRNDNAIVSFDKAISAYKQFSDAKYYKSLVLSKQGKKEESKILKEEALIDIRKGFTINEDNSLYEEYPYQIKKYWIIGAYKD